MREVLNFGVLKDLDLEWQARARGAHATLALAEALTQQHLTTLNQVVEGGRAESAPTLNNVESFVQAWYDDYEQEVEGDNGEENDDQKGKVKFCPLVRFRAIPSVGKARKVEPREKMYRRGATGDLDTFERAAIDCGRDCHCRGGSP